ncbi:MAG: DEAD/DEAH box helicase [Abditibacteriota bacterium]|nr:DEAD/DEAH box helicase [Abditibacteriota bacterium]
MDYRALLRRLEHDRQLACVNTREAQAAVFADLPPGLSPRVAEDLRWNFGIKRLFSHQRQAWDLLQEGRDIIITTPTSSGKSLCYNLPVAHAVCSDAPASALYIYPTKALAADQLKKLSEFECLKGRVFTYDGDTPRESREYVRKQASIVLTNPDMLHMGILPYHTNWSSFLHRLRYIVTDEVHTYTGLFASHMAFVLRRLLALCSEYGSRPSLIFTSGTVSDPAELAEKLSGRPFVTVDRSGAPSGSRTIAFWNPPVAGADGELRRSAADETSRLMTEALTRGCRTIAFGKSRLSVELMTRKVKEALKDRAGDLSDKVVSYRAGYTPERRRHLEQLIFSGKVRGILSTSALELGIDIGSLDVCLSAGYPRRLSALWQQFGRVGRGENDSLCVFVAQNSPIDQYYMQNPGEFFDGKVEACVVDLCNPYVVTDQLACSLRELPRTAREIFEMFGETGLEMLSGLYEEGLAGYMGGRFVWLGTREPSGEVNIRGALGEPCSIMSMEETGVRLLGTCDAARTLWTLYEGAVYIHEGDSYIVRRLDREENCAWVEPTRVNYYTVTNESYSVSEKRALARGQTRCGFIRYGYSSVTVSVPSYTKKALQGGRILGKTPLDLPDTELYTQSVCFDVPREAADRLKGRGMDPAGAIHALEHALIAVAPILVSCDRNDLGGVSFLTHPASEGRPCIFIYDGVQGGCGICGKLFADYEAWFEKAYQAVTACPCRDGCPACVQSPKCGNNNSPLDKQGAVYLLEELLKGR